MNRKHHLDNPQPGPSSKRPRPPSFELHPHQPALSQAKLDSEPSDNISHRIVATIADSSTPAVATTAKITAKATVQAPRWTKTGSRKRSKTEITIVAAAKATTRPNPVIKSKQAARGTSGTKRAKHDGKMRCGHVEMRCAEIRAGRIYARAPTHPKYDPATHFTPEVYAKIDLTKNGVDAMGPILEEMVWELFNDMQKRILAAQSGRDLQKAARLMYIIFFTDFSPGPRPIDEHCHRCTSNSFPCMVLRGQKDCLGCFMSKGGCHTVGGLQTDPMSRPISKRFSSKNANKKNASARWEDTTYIKPAPWTDLRLWVHRELGVPGLGDHLGHIAWDANLPPVPQLNPFSRKVAEAAAKRVGPIVDRKDRALSISTEAGSESIPAEASRSISPTTSAEETPQNSTSGTGEMLGMHQSKPMHRESPPMQRAASVTAQSLTECSSAAGRTVSPGVISRLTYSVSAERTGAYLEDIGYIHEEWPLASPSSTPETETMAETSIELDPPDEWLGRFSPQDISSADALICLGLPRAASLPREMGGAAMERMPARSCLQLRPQLIASECTGEEESSGSDDESLEDIEDTAIPDTVGGTEDVDLDEGWDTHSEPECEHTECHSTEELLLSQEQIDTLLSRHLPSPMSQSHDAVALALRSGNTADPAYTNAWLKVRSHALELSRHIRLQCTYVHMEPLHMTVRLKAQQYPFTRHLLEERCIDLSTAIRRVSQGEYARRYIGPLARRVAPNAVRRNGAYVAGRVVLLGVDGLWGTLLVDGTMVKCFASREWERKLPKRQILRLIKSLGHPTRSVSYTPKTHNAFVTPQHGTAFALWAFEKLAADAQWMPGPLDHSYLLALRKRHAVLLAEDQRIALAMAEALRDNAELVNELMTRAGL